MIKRFISFLAALCIGTAFAQLSPVVISGPVNSGVVIGGSVGNGTGAASTPPSFVLDFLNSQSGAIPTRGAVAPSFVRATVATVTDQDLVVRQVLSGEIRWGGFRKVRNLLLATEGLDTGSWTKAGTASVTKDTIAPDGTTTAFTVNFPAAADSITQTFSFTSGNSLRMSIWIKADVAGTIRLAEGGSGSQDTALSVTTAWQRYSPANATANTAVPQFFMQRNGAGQLSKIYVWHPLSEDVTGQTNQNPAEYVSVGVLSAPYQGANVDGVQYFPYLNGNTVASNVVTEARGAAISSAILGGYLPEPAATDLLTARADARDMTTANWTLGATMTRARTSVGWDGVASKATLLTGGAVAATNTILTTITAAASSRTYSVGCKRVTGTGPVRITQDGFATNTDISSSLNSSTYTLVAKAQSQLNAQLGLKIDTNGDQIACDWNQFSAGDLTGLVNSRIPDTISTRNADVLTYATTGWLNAAAGTLYAEWFNPNLSQLAAIASINDNTANNRIVSYVSSITSASTIVVNGGVTQANLGAVSVTGGTIAKSVNIYQANDFAGYANNTSLGTDGAGTIPTVTQLQIGIDPGAGQPGHYVRKVAYYKPRMANTPAQNLTTP